MSESAVMEKKAKLKELVDTKPAKPRFWIDIEALQALIDEEQRGEVLPQVGVGSGTYQAMEKEPRLIEIGDGVETRKELKYLPQPVVEYDANGNVVPASGAVILESFVLKLQELLMPKVMHQVLKAHHNMAESHAATGTVEKRARAVPNLTEFDL